MRTLDEMLQPGQAVRVFYGDGNINNKIRHIRAIVDEEQIVYRVWGKRVGWYYHVADRYEFEYMHEKGRLS